MSTQMYGMKIKEGSDIYTDDFWYDLTGGGYLKYKEFLADEKDIERVEAAIAVIIELQGSIEEYMDEQEYSVDDE